MAVEFVSAAFVHQLIQRIGEARTGALEAVGPLPAPGSPTESDYWETVLEANAALVLRNLTHTHLAAGLTVRYRFYDNVRGDLRIRPFVTRTTTDVTTLKRLLEWHPPPDVRGSGGHRPQQYRDVDLLYRHFSVTRTAEGVFEYWFAMQEIWASTHWAHARVIASAPELSQLSSQLGWHCDREVEHCAPAVVTAENDTSHLAVLVYSPLTREAVTLEHIEIGADQSMSYGEPVTVASGPKGYLV